MSGKGDTYRKVNKAQYDRNYLKIFGRKCDICSGRGWLSDEYRHGKIIKTTCLICNGSGKRTD